MQKNLLVIGAGGHGRLIAGMAEQTGKYNDIFFLDDAGMKFSGNYRVIDQVANFKDYLSNSVFFVALGDNALRRKISQEILDAGGKLESFIHPRAVIDEDVVLGNGIAIIAGAVVNKGAVIGDCVIINTLNSVYNERGDVAYSHITSGA